MSKYFYDNTSGTKLVIVTTMAFKCVTRAPKIFPSDKKSSSRLIFVPSIQIEYLLVQGVHFYCSKSNYSQYGSGTKEFGDS